MYRTIPEMCLTSRLHVRVRESWGLLINQNRIESKSNLSLDWGLGGLPKFHILKLRAHVNVLWVYTRVFMYGLTWLLLVCFDFHSWFCRTYELKERQRHCRVRTSHLGPTSQQLQSESNLDIKFSFTENIENYCNYHKKHAKNRVGEYKTNNSN